VFHAAQSFFVIVNDGITQGQQIWLMAGVFLVMALIVALLERGRFIRKPAQPYDVVPAAHSTTLSRPR
jgi:hypothetical protein